MKIGENIKKLRELKNFTQQYLADELNLSLSGYGKIERDQTELTIGRLFRICEILEVDIFTLITFNGKDIFNSCKPSKEQKTENDSNNFTLDATYQLINKYKEENQYLKELVNRLIVVHKSSSKNS
jgi:transcriptional regulator with XRE-family HTH domain